LELLKQSPMQDVSTRLQQQIIFILEIDKLKNIIRRLVLLDKSRNENDAEHSWHLAMIATVLAEYANANVNMARVIRMLLIHDIVEIDAGDTFLYDNTGFADSKADRENKAADRIYQLLPDDIGSELRSLWDEFEARESDDAIFAAAIDKLQPLLFNYFSDGGTWVQYNITATQVLETQQIIEKASKPLWQFVHALITDASNRGFLKK